MEGAVEEEGLGKAEMMVVYEVERSMTQGKVSVVVMLVVIRFVVMVMV